MWFNIKVISSIDLDSIIIRDLKVITLTFLNIICCCLQNVLRDRCVNIIITGSLWQSPIRLLHSLMFALMLAFTLSLLLHLMCRLVVGLLFQLNSLEPPKTTQ
jgi:hypothetical protein